MSGRIPLLGEIWEMSRSRGAESEAPYLWNGLVGAWPLQEGGGTTAFDVSGFGNHGTLTNMDPATDWMTWQHGRGLDFDGSNEYVDVTEYPINGWTGFTAAVWLRPVTGNTDTILGQYHGLNAGFLFYYQEASTRLRGGITTSGGWAGTNAPDGSAPLDTWTHGAIVWNGATIALHANGVFQSSNTAASINANASTVNFRIGEGGGTPWLGQLSNCVLYDRGLGQSELDQLYESPWSMYRRRPTQVPVAAVNDVTGTNPFGSSGVDFTWTVNP